MKLEFVTTFIDILLLGLWLTLPIWLPMLMLVLLLGFIIARQENWSTSDGLYFGMITATTVGYGDLRPAKKASKTIAIVIALIGLLLTGIVVSVGLKAATISFEQHHNLEQIKCGLNGENC